MFLKVIRTHPKTHDIMANYPQELAQDAVCQSHTGHMTGLWFLPSPAFQG